MNKRKTSAPAEVLREYGPFEQGEVVHGVSFDGERVWVATGQTLRAFDPADGRLTRALEVACDAGTAFDGAYLWQLGQGRIQKVDPHTGEVLASLPAPPGSDNAGLTWAEGKLWVGQHQSRAILQIDCQTGLVLKTLRSDRFVTGVSWSGGELWHGTLEAGASELRRVDPESAEVLARLTLPEGTVVTGLEGDGADVLYCGGGQSGQVRAVRRPR